ncbi:MAG TPA: tRNA(Ile)(2)-agmatinylcytidine synthase [Candidatus Bathyarchaeia archaeon]|nr:tRNA(Ile)(2)-agmatinylcytidine synthase [Candidatus Bathyarchaeia archaeon]
MRTEFHIGIDDTDSRLGGCTTYTVALIFRELVSKGFKPLDYPWLVRLNPNIPWKTRGNGALSLHFNLKEDEVADAKKIAIAAVQKTSDLARRSTDPAVVFLKRPVPSVLRDFSTRALHDVLSVREARHIAGVVDAEVFLLKGSRGLIGAFAGVGADLSQDHTFEIIAYRTPEYVGTERRVNQNSVRQMNEKYQGSTFNNIDPETGRILICPHGPDPVLFGIRGEDPVTLVQAFKQIEVEEPIASAMIFKTNQGTDAHLNNHRTIETLRPYQSTTITGEVSNAPERIRGGHVIFGLCDETGKIDCAAYSPAGDVRDGALQLIPGDFVTVSGGIRRRPLGEITMNVEKLKVTRLVDAVRWENPLCSRCGARCESMGKDQAFRCKRCKARFPKTQRIKRLDDRDVRLGEYLPPPRAHRHLTKPASRYEINRSMSPETNSTFIDRTLESLVLIPTVV